MQLDVCLWEHVVGWPVNCPSFRLKCHTPTWPTPFAQMSIVVVIFVRQNETHLTQKGGTSLAGACVAFPILRQAAFLHGSNRQ